MAAQLHDDDGELGELHDINVTPFIDVILVLLIIFMIAAPLSTVDVPVDLPVSNANSDTRPSEPVFVTLKADRSISIGNATIAAGELGTRLDAASAGDRQQRIYVRADKAVPYGEVMQLMNGLRQNGYLKIGLVGLESLKPPAATGTSGSP